ncbi:NAD(P)-binding protein [Actinoplanes sp. NPDC049596]|uniref:NAD(P)-binding protein n=1 Tax=unclassified Actinoplanes TaxID=2626549 RepID=UPI00344A7553
MTEVDYLVVGAGTAGMAFTDELISNSGHTVLMVDRRHAPGGHWNDAYPFVRLHQPSAFYGVSSRNLGANRIDEWGPNAGLYERATGLEVCSYYQSVMQERFLQSGRVTFRPMTECRTGDGAATLTSLLTGESSEIKVRKKIVDARYLEGSIPATHRRSFAVDEDVRCIPVNELVHADHWADRYVVIGGGKTGMDACLWLMDNGVAPEAIQWVRPHDAWIIPREKVQPLDLIPTFLISWAESVEACAAASDVTDLFRRLESHGHLTRIDLSVDPTMYRAASASKGELDALRRIERVTAGEHVRRIASDRIHLEHSDTAVSGRPLYVDCTAAAITTPPERPVFQDGRITIQTVRAPSPSFNAALAGYLEATRDDPAEQNYFAPPTRHPRIAAGWIRNRLNSMVAASRWSEAADIARWVGTTRLSITAGAGKFAGEPEVAAALKTSETLNEAARQNLATLAESVPDS